MQTLLRSWRHKRRTAALLLCGLAGAGQGHATEGGGLSVYPDGIENYHTGALPPPGLYTLVYGGRSHYDQVRDDSGHALPITGFKVNVDVLAPRLVWVTSQQVFGGQLALHGFLPLLRVDASAGGQHARHTGVGDIAFGPALGWHHSATLHTIAAVDFVAPTGRYDRNDLANLGRNHWAVQPVFAVSRIDPAGWNADVKLMWDVNLRNHDTATRSGQAVHADLALGWGLGNGWTLGAGGYVYRQVSDDSGPNASAGKATANAVGPSLRYTHANGLLLTVKVQKEFAVRNRPQGQQLWFKAVLPF